MGNARRLVPDILGEVVDLGPMNPHGSNILSKLTNPKIAADAGKSELIKAVAASYLDWREAAMAADATNEDAFVAEQVARYEKHRNLLDDPRMDIFDSRGALQPSALEEFCFFLFRRLLDGFAPDLAIGHFEVYQAMYFSAVDFADFARLPTPRFPVGNLDFVIGKKLTVQVATDVASHSRVIVVPAVAIECKTYLDRPRWVESDQLANRIKTGFPRCLYVVISEFLKLDLAKVDVVGSRVDRIYVFRRAQNVDRSIRRAGGTGLSAIHVPAVIDFYRQVKNQLTEPWFAGEDWADTCIIK